MTLDSTAIPLASAVIALFSMCFAWRNSSVAGKKLQVDALLAFSRETNTSEFRNAVRKVVGLNFTSAAEFSQQLRSLAPEDEAMLTNQILLVTQFFDNVGYLVRKRRVERDLVRAAYGAYIVEVWQHMSPVLSVSMHSRSDVYPHNFAWLATEMMKTIKPYSEMQQAEIRARLARIADGTATEADRTFGQP